MAVTPVVPLALRSRCHPARYCRSLAPERVAALLDEEERSISRPTAHLGRDQRTHRQTRSREPSLGQRRHPPPQAERLSRLLTRLLTEAGTKPVPPRLYCPLSPTARPSPTLHNPPSCQTSSLRTLVGRQRSPNLP